jgi:hypothetical protein
LCCYVVPRKIWQPWTRPQQAFALRLLLSS